MGRTLQPSEGMCEGYVLRGFDHRPCPSEAVVLCKRCDFRYCAECARDDRRYHDFIHPERDPDHRVAAHAMVGATRSLEARFPAYRRGGGKECPCCGARRGQWEGGLCERCTTLWIKSYRRWWRRQCILSEVAVKKRMEERAWLKEGTTTLKRIRQWLRDHRAPEALPIRKPGFIPGATSQGS